MPQETTISFLDESQAIEKYSKSDVDKTWECRPNEHQQWVSLTALKWDCWILLDSAEPEHNLANGRVAEVGEAMDWLLTNGFNPPKRLLDDIEARKVMQAFRAQQKGCFIEWVERNPGKGAVEEFGPVERYIPMEGDNPFDRLVDVELLLRYPNNSWVIEAQRCFGRSNLGDPQFREITEVDAARWIITNRVQTSIGRLAWAKRILKAAGPEPAPELLPGSSSESEESQREAVKQSAPPEVKGPRAPGYFDWFGKTAELATIPYKLVEYLWKQPNYAAAIDDVCNEVWGDEMAKESSVPSARTKANNAFLKAEMAVSVSIKSGYVVLSLPAR